LILIAVAAGIYGLYSTPEGDPPRGEITSQDTPPNTSVAATVTSTDRPTEPSSSPAPKVPFETLLNQVARDLPHADALKSLDADTAHHAPIAITRAAAMLGDVAQAVHDDPSLAPRAFTFYRQCAEGDHPNTIRAFCLAKARSHAADSTTMQWESSLPQSVRDLSQEAQTKH